jgi:intein-encoded DNA endonuclease-like protein
MKPLTLDEIYNIVFPFVSKYEEFNDLYIKYDKWNNRPSQLYICVYFLDGNISAEDNNLERILIKLEALNECRKIKENDNFVVEV